MRKDDVLSLVDHMYWVNGRLLDAAAGLPVGAFTERWTFTTRDLRSMSWTSSGAGG